MNGRFFRKVFIFSKLEFLFIYSADGQIVSGGSFFTAKRIATYYAFISAAGQVSVQFLRKLLHRKQNCTRVCNG
jgi:hypothetical protein